MSGDITVAGEAEPQAASPAGARCRQCHKPIIWPGRCYTCATGLPRRLRMATSDGDGPPAQGSTNP